MKFLYFLFLAQFQRNENFIIFVKNSFDKMKKTSFDEMKFDEMKSSQLKHAIIKTKQLLIGS